MARSLPTPEDSSAQVEVGGERPSGNRLASYFAGYRSALSSHVEQLPSERLALSRTVMITLGEGWVVENGQLIHACGPEVRGSLCSGRARCDCGARVPRRVRLFSAWWATLPSFDRASATRATSREGCDRDPPAQRPLEELLASLRHDRGELADAKAEDLEFRCGACAGGDPQDARE